MAVFMNKEFLYCSVLECSTTTARVLFLTCEFTMFVVSQSWNVLALMCHLGDLYIHEEESLVSAPQPLCKRISVVGVGGENSESENKNGNFTSEIIIFI